jgi:hypothetical protein
MLAKISSSVGVRGAGVGAGGGGGGGFGVVGSGFAAGGGGGGAGASGFFFPHAPTASAIVRMATEAQTRKLRFINDLSSRMGWRRVH